MALLLRGLDDRTADQLVALAGLAWADGETIHAAAEAFGWTPGGPHDAAYLTTGGHPVYPLDFGAPGPVGADTACLVPFAYLYEASADDVPDELLGLRTDLTWFRGYAGHDARWRYDRTAGRGLFDETCHAVTELFVDRLGPADLTARFPDGTSDDERPPWHYAAWRLRDKMLLVGQAADPVADGTFEYAAVRIGRYPTGARLPSPDDLWLLMEG
ncbi:hypothetical protein [Yinghuangia seranimata]|uniref:hypothetical protein n=1 Tax=Yinghuangia seranimata TaxID=408067 RepID=UPI00248C6876|nr:hypothetical protein [Yinghuangia seranimata]MDI2132738.1 hypothetical protein [Yinghuangia seranimata]